MQEASCSSSRAIRNYSDFVNYPLARSTRRQKVVISVIYLFLAILVCLAAFSVHGSNSGRSPLWVIGFLIVVFTIAGQRAGLVSASANGVTIQRIFWNSHISRDQIASIAVDEKESHIRGVSFSQATPKLKLVSGREIWLKWYADPRDQSANGFADNIAARVRTDLGLEH